MSQSTGSNPGGGFESRRLKSANIWKTGSNPGRGSDSSSEISDSSSICRPIERANRQNSSPDSNPSIPDVGSNPVLSWDNYHFALLPPWGYHAQIMKVLLEMVHLVHSISEKCPSAETGFEPGAHPTANALVVRLDVLTQVVPFGNWIKMDELTPPPMHSSFGWMY